MKKFTKKALKGLKKEKEFSNRLSKRVINDLLTNGYTTEELKYYMEDILQYGCSGGLVSSLIYYSETTRFFNNYREEILNLFKEFIHDTESYHENCQGKYIKIYDTIIYEDQRKYTMEEKNNLSWFAYEETVRRIAQEYFEL